MSSVLDKSRNPRRLVTVKYTSVPFGGEGGGDFSNGFPFLYVSPTGVLYARRDDELGYEFMSTPANIEIKLSEDMYARRQVKSIDSSLGPILEQFLAGIIVGGVSNMYVYRSTFASLYQATTLRFAGDSGVTTTPPSIVTGTLSEPTFGSQTVGGGTYSGYTMPAHTFWALDMPLVIEFTDTGDSTVKYFTLSNSVTQMTNLAFTTMN